MWWVVSLQQAFKLNGTTERNNFGDICSLAGLKKLVKTTRDICFAALNIKISKAFRACFYHFNTIYRSRKSYVFIYIV